jgi:hypothetical protein
MAEPLPSATAGAPNRLQLIKDLRARWTKFSESDLMLMTNKDALVDKVAEKYGRELALREVEAVLKGRSL